MEFYGVQINLSEIIKIVSIPNGMEFYKSLALMHLFFLLVSIPNGMEFYFFFSNLKIAF